MMNEAAKMEAALANALQFAVENGDPDFLERILRLIIKKEIVLELLLEELFPPPPPPPPPPGCETCSIFYNQGDVPAVLTSAANPPPGITGMADPLRIRLCPCNQPDRNEVVLQFNAAGTANDFRFEGFITDIISCDAATNNAEFRGEGTIRGGADYDFDLTIVTDPVTGVQTITFIFTNQADPADTFTVVLTPPIENPDKRVDIVDCTGG